MLMELAVVEGKVAELVAVSVPDTRFVVVAVSATSRLVKTPLNAVRVADIMAFVKLATAEKRFVLVAFVATKFVLVAFAKRAFCE
jgi:hypothetical protein